MARPTGERGISDSPNVPYILVPDDGLEIHHTRPLQGLQIIPAELYLQVAPETLPGPEKEVYGSRTSGLCSDKTPVLKSSIIPKKRQRWKLWLSIIAVALLIVVIATALPLELHRSRDSRYEEI